MYNPNIWMEAEIKFIKEPFQLIPVDLDLWDSIKNSSCERKKFIFLSNQESASMVSVKK